MKTRTGTLFMSCLSILVVLVVLLSGCKDEGAASTDTSSEIPRHDSGIVMISERLVDTAADIVLSAPKPFQTEVLDATTDVLFQFSPNVGSGEVLIFNQRPDIEKLRSGIADGCVAGNSKLAGHSWTGTTANLSLGASRNQFYTCLSGVNLLSQTEKKTLSAGTYYWFVVGYDDNYLVSQSSDVRILFIQ